MPQDEKQFSENGWPDGVCPLAAGGPTFLGDTGNEYLEAWVRYVSLLGRGFPLLRRESVRRCLPSARAPSRNGCVGPQSRMNAPETHLVIATHRNGAYSIPHCFAVLFAA